MNKKSLNIEFIRIFAIFMTIAIHVSNLYISSFSKVSDGYFLTSVIFNSLSRICVPLFFMISGALSIPKEFSLKKYCNRILRFVFVLMIWSFIYYIQKNGFEFKNISIIFVNSIFNANMTSRHLWYMYAFIGINIALPFIQNMCKNLNRQQENLFLTLWIILSGISVIIIPFAKAITKTNINFSYPIPMINATYYLGYFISGHIIYKRFNNASFDKTKNIICIITFVLSTAITAFFTYYISIKTNKLFDSMLWYKSIFIILATFSIFLLFISNKGAFKNSIIPKLSTHSFGIYLIHIVFLNIIKGHFTVIEYNPIVTIPVATLIIYIASLVSCIILSKIPYINKILF